MGPDQPCPVGLGLGEGGPVLLGGLFDGVLGGLTDGLAFFSLPRFSSTFSFGFSSRATLLLLLLRRRLDRLFDLLLRLLLEAFLRSALLRRSAPPRAELEYFPSTPGESSMSFTPADLPAGLWCFSSSLFTKGLYSFSASLLPFVGASLLGAGLRARDLGAAVASPSRR